MKLVLAVAAAAAIAAASPALADDGSASAYVNLGYTADQASDGTLSTVTGRVGLRGNQVGMEGEYSGSLGDTTISGVKVAVRDQWAGYIIGFLPVGKNGEVFFRGGLGGIDLKSPTPGALTFTSSWTTNLGVGGQWFFGHNNGVRVDYTYTRLNDAESHINNFGVSYVHKF
jgi:hypothetical protein